MRLFAATVIAGILAGCAIRGSDALVCDHSDRAVLPVAAAHLPGEFRLALVSTEGLAAGEKAELRLTLVAQEDELRTVPGIGGEPLPGVEQPFRGWIEGDLAAIGAAAPGDLESLDPRAPGVSVLRMEAAGNGQPRVVLRLGSEANRRDRVAFDEAFAVLRVHSADERGFSGAWESGGGGGARAAGYFCAVRSEP